jgi:uncharacterized membrane protein SpoIIM required for sporulation
MFRGSRKEFLWALRIFSGSALVASILSSVIYILMMMLSDPEPVSSAIATTAVAATSKVEIAARYISPFVSIFLFNTIAALTASMGAGMFLLIHNVLVKEIDLRSRHRRYADISIRMEKLLIPFHKIFKRIFSVETIYHSDKDVSTGHSIWDLCGYTKDDYRSFARMLPHVVPSLTLVANGVLFGILFSFFMFNGAVEGYRTMGAEGVGLGILYNIVYFATSIIPHGILELPALFMAAALGHGFANMQSKAIIKEGLFTGDDMVDMKRDVAHINSITIDLLRSGYFWKILLTITCVLMMAAYIEVYVTPEIVEDVMGSMGMVVDLLLD